MTNQTSFQVDTRLRFIDFARGLVMIIMAWDHVSGFWNANHFGSEGLIPIGAENVNVTQFLLRFVTHWAAPTFIFLAGTSVALSATKRRMRGDSEAHISQHIALRGLVLLLAAFFLESAFFGLPPFYFGVLACIGACFLILSVARRLPVAVVLALSLTLLLAHGLLNFDSPLSLSSDPWLRYFLAIIYQPGLDNPPFFVLYPIIPWVFVMALGWTFGVFLTRYNWEKGTQLVGVLAGAGAVMLMLWFVVRWLNGYGNFEHRNGATLVDWLYMSKYPPDLAFLLWGLGGMSLFMAVGLASQNRPWFAHGIPAAIMDLGRVPLFFYLAHLWFYRIDPFFAQTGFHAPLLAIGIFWLIGLIVLWWLGKHFEQWKLQNPGSLLQYI